MKKSPSSGKILIQISDKSSTMYLFYIHEKRQKIKSKFLLSADLIFFLFFQILRIH